jgi:hypothetical protein
MMTEAAASVIMKRCYIDPNGLEPHDMAALHDDRCSCFAHQEQDDGV